MKKYTVDFIGNKAGAIGNIYKIHDTIEALNDSDFIEKLYKKYDNVSKLKVNGKYKNK